MKTTTTIIISALAFVAILAININILLDDATYIKVPHVIHQTNTHAIPDDYYNQTSSPSNASIMNELRNWKWNREYEINVFDCSDMSAYLEYYLENRGFNTTICTGDHHAWILINIDDTEIAYETTGCYFVYNDPEYYSPDKKYNTIYDLHEYYLGFYYGQESFDEEYAWWL